MAARTVPPVMPVPVAPASRDGVGPAYRVADGGDLGGSQAGVVAAGAQAGQVRPDRQTVLGQPAVGGDATAPQCDRQPASAQRRAGKHRGQELRQHSTDGGPPNAPGLAFHDLPRVAEHRRDLPPDLGAVARVAVEEALGPLQHRSPHRRRPAEVLTLEGVPEQGRVAVDVVEGGVGPFRTPHQRPATATRGPSAASTCTSSTTAAPRPRSPAASPWPAASTPPSRSRTRRTARARPLPWSPTAAHNPADHLLVGMAGFEPTAPRSQSECATKLRHIP